MALGRRRRPVTWFDSEAGLLTNWELAEGLRALGELRFPKNPNIETWDDYRLRIWRRLWDLQDGRCAYCLGPMLVPGDPAGRESGMNGKRMSLDHVIPRCQGGSHHISNLVAACKGCNSGKRDRLWTPRVPRHRIAEVA